MNATATQSDNKTKRLARLNRTGKIGIQPESGEAEMIYKAGWVIHIGL
jgi:hypothetical protein